MEEAPTIESEKINKLTEIQLSSENFSLIKDSNNNCKLKIKLNSFGKEENFFFDLEQNTNLKMELEDIKKQNLELKEIIKYKDEKIKLLEEKLNKYITIEKENFRK